MKKKVLQNSQLRKDHLKTGAFSLKLLTPVVTFLGIWIESTYSIFGKIFFDF